MSAYEVIVLGIVAISAVVVAYRMVADDHRKGRPDGASPLADEVRGIIPLDQEPPDGMAAYVQAIRRPDPADPAWPLPSFDARDWAKSFCERYPDMDEGLMTTWFANALMRGYDQAALDRSLEV